MCHAYQIYPDHHKLYIKFKMDYIPVEAPANSNNLFGDAILPTNGTKIFIIDIGIIIIFDEGVWVCMVLVRFRNSYLMDMEGRKMRKMIVSKMFSFWILMDVWYCKYDTIKKNKLNGSVLLMLWMH
eukprot:28151_1